MVNEQQYMYMIQVNGEHGEKKTYCRKKFASEYMESFLK